MTSETPDAPIRATSSRSWSWLSAPARRASKACHRLTVAVRGGPVINDATLDDARRSGLTDPTLGISIAVAIAIHNIPEGLAVSAPIFFYFLFSNINSKKLKKSEKTHLMNQSVGNSRFWWWRSL